MIPMQSAEEKGGATSVLEPAALISLSAGRRLFYHLDVLPLGEQANQRALPSALHDIFVIITADFLLIHC